MCSLARVQVPARPTASSAASHIIQPHYVYDKVTSAVNSSIFSFTLFFAVHQSESTLLTKRASSVIAVSGIGILCSATFDFINENFQSFDIWKYVLVILYCILLLSEFTFLVSTWQ